jgi:hypothetical protein
MRIIKWIFIGAVCAGTLASAPGTWQLIGRENTNIPENTNLKTAIKLCGKTENAEINGFTYSSSETTIGELPSIKRIIVVWVYSIVEDSKMIGYNSLTCTWDLHEGMTVWDWVGPAQAINMSFSTEGSDGTPTCPTKANWNELARCTWLVKALAGVT